MRLTVAAAGLAVALTGIAVPPAAADENPLCDSVQADSPRQPVTLSNAPFSQLELHRAQLLVRHDAPPGPPVRVAVLDSGVAPGRVPVAAAHSVAGAGPVSYYHGTAVAGLIAGPLGVAPDAEIVDVRVYDGVDPTEGRTLTADRLADGLKWVYENARRYDIKVANVSLAVGESRRLKHWVQQVRGRGVLVVAAAGNRPQQGDPFDDEFADGTAAPDEDAVEILYPTTYDEVISASTTADGSGSADVTEFVVKNSNTTVAVPTWDAISYGLDGRPCVIEPAATSWAAAEVSGVLALLWQMYPDDTASQIQARLVETANGTSDDRNPLTGAGVVQPYEALTRPLDPSRSGRVERSTVAEGDAAPAVAPQPREDLLADTRDDAVWWGLVGGGLLVVALLVRPVVARRRS
ncbi:S8 family serine peptidase [Nocardioides aquiterrae]|uniref:Peptidase S8/S53 domain-containing protein n=1 Tax=Nocardioides aquiterrae TaxID=203799 RepID=A0ABP4F3H7_9ACTN